MNIRFYLMILLLTMFLPNSVHANKAQMPEIYIDIETKELTFTENNNVMTYPISIGTELSPTLLVIIPSSKNQKHGGRRIWLKMAGT